MEKNNNPLLKLLNGIRANANDTPMGLYYNLNLLPDLADFNRADTDNMSNNEMNKFRHIAGTKQAINDTGIRGLMYSLGNEFYDITRDGWSDTKEDLKNDFRALKLHIKEPQLDSTELYNYVFQNYIKPYRK